MTKQEMIFLYYCRKGLVDPRINDRVSAILDGMEKNIVAEVSRPVTIIDDSYDGKNDESMEITLNPNEPLNIMWAVMREGYGDELGQAGFLLLMTAHCKPCRDKWKYVKMVLDEGSYKFDEIRKPTRKELEETPVFEPLFLR